MCLRKTCHFLIVRAAARMGVAVLIPAALALVCSASTIPAPIDLTSSAPISPGTSFTLTAQLPTSIQCELVDGTTQTVQLLGATFNVTTAPSGPVNSGYASFTITHAQGAFGPAVFNGGSIPGSSFTLAGPGIGRIDYPTGVLVLQMEMIVAAPGLPSTRVLTYTTGQVLSPTTVRLLMDGSSVPLENASDIPAVPTIGLLVLALALFLVGASHLVRYDTKKGLSCSLGHS